MLVFIFGSIRPARFVPARTVPAEISIRAVTYIPISNMSCKLQSRCEMEKKRDRELMGPGKETKN